MIQENDNAITLLDEEFLKKHIFDECNKVFVRGTIIENFEFSHNRYNQNFYKTKIKLIRISRREDVVPIIISESLIEQEAVIEEVKGRLVKLAGQLRTRMDNGHKLIYLYVKAIHIYDNNEDEFKEMESLNSIYLNGYICQQPYFKRTRERNIPITKFMLAVNGTHGDPEYIPCMAWGKDAILLSNSDIGTRISVYGRIQSRIFYQKKFYSIRTRPIEVYEVSGDRVKIEKY